MRNFYGEMGRSIMDLTYLGGVAMTKLGGLFISWSESVGWALNGDDKVKEYWVEGSSVRILKVLVMIRFLGT